jgi:phytoene synthase
MPPSALDARDLAACGAMLRAGSKSFSLAARLLPARVRESATVLYAFCRVADDAVDADTQASVATVDALRARLTRAYAGAPDDTPVDRALAAVVARLRLPRALLDALLEGMAWDAEGRRYETLGDLHAYAARVAGAVGAMMTVVMGPRAPEVLARACDLGVAMQLTNILRDIVEDGQRGRVYLPSEDLERFGCGEIATAEPERVAELIRFEAARAAQWFDRGMLITEQLDGRSAACVQAMTGIYRRILVRIVEDPQAVLNGRISLSTAEKSWVAVRSLAGSAAEALTSARASLGSRG